MKYVKIVLLCHLSFIAVSAQEHISAGTRAFAFLNIDYDAYSTGMGGASVAVPGGANEIMVNSAGQGFRKSDGFYISYNPLFDDIQGVSAGISRSVKPYGVMSLSVISLSSGEFSVIEDNNGVPEVTGETAGMNSLAGAFSWAYKFDDYFSAGVTLTGIYEKISDPQDDVTASGVAINTGIQYRFFRNRLVLGGVIKNIGYMINDYSDIRYKLPVGVSVGVSYVPRNFPNARIALDLDKRAGDYLVIHPGLELYVYQKYVAVRVGMPFSIEDIRNVGNNDFVKSHSSTLAVGLGVNPVIKNIMTRFNFALQMRTAGLPPSILVSNSTEF